MNQVSDDQKLAKSTSGKKGRRLTRFKNRIQSMSRKQLLILVGTVVLLISVFLIGLFIYGNVRPQTTDLSCRAKVSSDEWKKAASVLESNPVDSRELLMSKALIEERCSDHQDQIDYIYISTIYHISVSSHEKALEYLTRLPDTTGNSNFVLASHTELQSKSYLESQIKGLQKASDNVFDSYNITPSAEEDSWN